MLLLYKMYALILPSDISGSGDRFKNLSFSWKLSSDSEIWKNDKGVFSEDSHT